MNKIVRATAGAGKTTGLLNSVYNVYKDFFKKEGRRPKVLLSTFTIKAANELSERLILKAIELNDEDFLEYVSSSFLEVGTLHSIFLKVLDQINDGEITGEQKYFSESHRNKVERGIFHDLIIEEGAQNFFIEARTENDVLKAFTHIYRNSNTDPKVLTFEYLKSFVQDRVRKLVLGSDDKKAHVLCDQGGSTLLKYIKGLDFKEQKKFKELKNILIDEANTEEFLKSYSKRHKLYQRLYTKWNQRLTLYIKDNHISSIFDTEVQVLNKLIEKKFDEKIWDFSFFDEYQDTSPMQEKIINILSQKSRNYFVGDPFQSIYFFRGARKEIFLKEFTKIKESGGQSEYMLNNYRSAPEIVEFANKLTKFMLPDFVEMKPIIENVKGSVKVVHFKEGVIRDEFLYVIKELKGIDLEKESVAILSKESKSLLDCSKELRKAKVEYKFSFSKGFESSLEIIELISFLSFLLDPDNDENILILLMSFWCKISDLEIQTGMKKIKNGEAKSLWDIFSEKEGVLNLKKLFKISKKLPYSVVLLEFIGSSGFLDFSENLDPTKGREFNILKLVSALEEEEKKNNFNLQGFIDDILRGSYRFESEEIKPSSGCFLMTIHGSKGLQFDHVYVIGLNKSNSFKPNPYYFNLEENLFSLKDYSVNENQMIFPMAVTDLALSEKIEMLAENKRLFYVAMTRAKKTLSLIGSKKISKVSTAPSWLSLTLDFLIKTKQEKDFFSELEPFKTPKESRFIGKNHEGFFLWEGFSQFLDKKKKGITKKNESEFGNYKGDVARFLKLSFAISEGVFFHEMMERVQNLEEAEGEVKASFKENEEKHLKAVRYLFEQKSFPFSQILLTGEREWGFDYNGEFKVSGKIDLWSKIDDEVWIVDYKTGSSKQVEKGFSQLKEYKDMLAEYFKSFNNLKYNLVLTFPYEKKTLLKIGV